MKPILLLTPWGIVKFAIAMAIILCVWHDMDKPAQNASAVTRDSQEQQWFDAMCRTKAGCEQAKQIEAERD